MSLDGVRVVEMATLLPGPYAGARLVDLGADVVKVEPPAGDPAETMLPDGYAALNEGKTVVTLDLRDADDRRRFEERVADGDALVTSNRPSTLDKLDADPDSLHDLNPELVYVHLLGHADGERLGHDLTYQAAAGVPLDGVPPLPVADLAAAERVVQAVAVGLGDPGSVHRVTAETVAREWAEVAAEVHPLLVAEPGYGVFACGDGKPIALGCLEPATREALAEVLGLDAPDAEAIEAALAGEDRATWLERFERAGVPAEPVKRPPD